MKQLNKPTDNMGGLLKIWAVPYNKFYLSGKILTFSATDNIYEIYCSPESMQFSEVKEETRSGIRYNTVVNGFSPKDSEVLVDALEYIEPRKWVIVFIDGNGSYKLAGTAGQPLRLTGNLSSLKNSAERAGGNLQFAGLTLARSVFIDNPF